MINLCLIGPGRWGRRLLSSVQGVSSIVRFSHAVMGPGDSGKSALARHGVAICDWDDLAGSVDGVVIASPHTLHLDQLMRCIGAGLHIFVEKPVVMNQSEWQEVKSCLDGRRKVFAAGFNRRFLPAMEDLRARCVAGELGKIVHIEGHLSAPAGFNYQEGGWRSNPQESPAGGLAGAGIHVIDAFVSLLGAPSEAFAFSQNQVLNNGMKDTTSALVRFHCGATGYLGAVTVTAPDWFIRVYGDKGLAEVNGESSLVMTDLNGKKKAHTFALLDIERAELEAFARAIDEGGSFPISLEEIGHGVELFELICKSTTSGHLEQLA